MIVNLKTENNIYIISLEACYLSKYLYNLIESNEILSSENKKEELTIPIINIEDKTIIKIIEFAEYFIKDKDNSKKIKNIPKPLPNTDLKEIIPDWYYNFINNMDIENIFLIIKASNFLEINELLELACCMVANIIRGKSVEEIREKFGIINDFTPEEEEEIKKENNWCENL